MPVFANVQTSDPVSTVRLSRERILQALSDEETAQATGVRPARARTEPGATRDSSTIRARTEPGIADEPEEFDPVAIAAAAISRLRNRAKTDLGQLCACITSATTGSCCSARYS